MTAHEGNETHANRRSERFAKNRKTTAETTVAVAKVPQAHGGALNAGGSPGNRGGGRKPSAFKERLERIRDASAVALLEAVLSGRTPHATCEYCGREPSNSFGEQAPTIDARLRAAEMTMKYTIGLTKTIQLDGVRGVAEAFERIRSRIRATLPQEAAERLISSIADDLRGIR